MRHQRFSVDQIVLGQANNQIFAILIVAVGYVITIFRRVNMQASPRGLNGFTQHI